MKKLIFISFFLFVQLLTAQVEFTTKLSRTKIGLNENVRVEFSMNADGDNLQLPSFDNFKVVGGPYQQMSTSIINGKRSFSRSFGYVLQPTRQGVLTIGSATITINGQSYKTDPVQLTVTAPVARPNDTSEQLIEPGESVYLVAQVSKKNPYLNEPISITYKLYFKEGLGIRNFSPVENPEYNDFWSHNIEVKGYEVVPETFKGEQYSSVIVKRVVLYPQKLGKLSIAPLSMELALEVPTNRRDFFGRRMYSPTDAKVSTGITSIDVKPLPENGRPDDFSGAVGVFDFMVTTDKTAIRQGESVEMNITVSGKGNLELFSLPKPIAPSALEIYDPVPKNQVAISLTGKNGKVSDRYTIIPQYQGKYIIKPLRFSYFDLSTNSYKTLTSSEFTIDLIDGPVSGESPHSPNLAQTNKLSEKPQSRFGFIALKTNLKPIDSSDFLFSTKFFLYWILPLFLLPILIFVKRRKDRQQGDTVGNKQKSNQKLAQKYLAEAKKNQTDKGLFYRSIERAMHNFLKAKLRLETSEMTKEKIAELLTEKGVETSVVTEFISLFESAELARYAPSLMPATTQDYEKAVRVLSELQKQIR